MWYSTSWTKDPAHTRAWGRYIQPDVEVIGGPTQSQVSKWLESLKLKSGSDEPSLDLLMLPACALTIGQLLRLLNPNGVEASLRVFDGRNGDPSCLYAPSHFDERLDWHVRPPTQPYRLNGLQLSTIDCPPDQLHWRGREMAERALQGGRQPLELREVLAFCLIETSQLGALPIVASGSECHHELHQQYAPVLYRSHQSGELVIWFDGEFPGPDGRTRSWTLITAESITVGP